MRASNAELQGKWSEKEKGAFNEAEKAFGCLKDIQGCKVHDKSITRRISEELR